MSHALRVSLDRQSTPTRAIVVTRGLSTWPTTDSRSALRNEKPPSYTATTACRAKMPTPQLTRIATAAASQDRGSKVACGEDRAAKTCVATAASAANRATLNAVLSGDERRWSRQTTSPATARESTSAAGEAKNRASTVTASLRDTLTMCIA